VAGDENVTTRLWIKSAAEGYDVHADAILRCYFFCRSHGPCTLVQEGEMKKLDNRLNVSWLAMRIAPYATKVVLVSTTVLRLRELSNSISPF
jgi:hypothetical protein